MCEKYTETWTEFLERYPNLVFIRTKKKIYSADEVEENIVYEEDTLPLIKGQTEIIPIDETAYPRCFKQGTAMEIGMWCIYLCEKNGWEIKPSMVWEILKNQEENLAEEEERKVSSI